MTDPKISTVSRLLLLLCAVGLVVVLFVPMWRIDLQAPQYPEGLQLLIYPNKLAGNVDIINGLNHYIGMKTLHSDDFIEFKILPFIIGALFYEHRSAARLDLAAINRAFFQSNAFVSAVFLVAVAVDLATRG